MDKFLVLEAFGLNNFAKEAMNKVFAHIGGSIDGFPNQ
jgi:hypothetical protein